MSFPAKASTQAGTSTRISGRSVTSLVQGFALRVPLLLMIASCAPLVESARSEDDATGAMSHLATLSLEDLSNIRVSTPSKHNERVADTPAAIFVITGEDVRRSGATHVFTGDHENR